MLVARPFVRWSGNVPAKPGGIRWNLAGRRGYPLADTVSLTIRICRFGIEGIAVAGGSDHDP